MPGGCGLRPGWTSPTDQPLSDAVARLPAMLAFDYGAMIDALDARRAEYDLGWTELADTLWGQSAVLNARLDDNCLCPGALVRNAQRRGPMSCQYALIMLRWIDRAPEDFLTDRYGRLRTVVSAGGDRLWLTTSETDGRGTPVKGDDRLLELEVK